MTKEQGKYKNAINIVKQFPQSVDNILQNKSALYKSISQLFLASEWAQKRNDFFYFAIKMETCRERRERWQKWQSKWRAE